MLFSALLSVVFAASIIAPGAVVSQVSTKVASVTPSSAAPKIPVTLRVALHQGETIEKVYLAYRAFGSGDYTRVEMDIVGNTAAATLPAQAVLPPFVEYYIVLLNRGGWLESYPLGEGVDPFETPPGKTLQLRVGIEGESDTQIVFLSPDPEVRVSPADALISVSLLRADSLVVKRATQILLDGADITAGAVMSDDIIVIAPENTGVTIRPGPHRLTVRLFNREGRLHRSASITFTVTGASVSMAEPTDAWRYTTSIQLESRHEEIGSMGTWYNRGSILFAGSGGDWRFNGNAFVTSDEKANRQPQNRYYASVESPWLRVGYGDAYPSFPNLIMSGKRVRGLVSTVRLDWFGVDLALGKTSRDIEGALLQTIGRDTLGAAQQADPSAAYAPINDTTWGKFSYGTFSRSLFVVRPSFGSGEFWQFGFTWLKSKDDVGSIRYGVRPQENIVLGTDFVARFDERRIEISGQGAFSAFNSDISSGTFTDADIDSLFEDESKRNEAREVRDILSKFITVNENLTPLSLKKLATAACDASLTLNYFDNALKFAYLFRGSDYSSLGQTFLRKDIQGITVTDRIRLAENRVFATAGIEMLKDNTSKSKIATTSFTNFNIAVSYFPDTEYPSATLGYGLFSSKNYLDGNAVYAIDDVTNRFFLQSSYDFQASGQHTALFNLTASNRMDYSSRQYNVKNITVSLGLNTKYSVPLQTNVDLSINANTLPTSATQNSSGQFNYTTLSLGARYVLVRDIFFIMASACPSFGDFKRTAWDSSIEWVAMQAMTFELQFGFYNNHGLANDTIWSLRYRYDI